MPYIFSHNKTSAAKPFRVIQPGKQAESISPPESLDHLNYQNIFKHIDKWYMQNLEAKEPIKNFAGAGALYPPLYRVGPWPDLVGRPCPQHVHPVKDSQQRWKEFRQHQQETAKFSQKPYRYYHYPWPDIIGIARADKRHHPEYLSQI